MSEAARRADQLGDAVRAHEAFLRRRLRGLGVAEGALDDAVQDVIEVLVRRIGAYDDRYSFRRWMAGVARKIARRHRERAHRAPLSLLDDRVEDTAVSPEEAAARAEARELLGAFLGTLDQDRWAVFVLSEIEGLRGTEIAAELDVNLSTVYARLRSARRAFDRAVARRRRQHAAWLPAWLPFRSRPAAAVVTVGAAVSLGAALALTVGAGSCAERNAGDPGHRVASASVGPTVASPAHAIATPPPTEPSGSGPGAVDDPEGPAPTPTRDEDGWTPAGSGAQSSGGATLSTETAVRVSPGLIEVRLRVIGDDDLATDWSRQHFELDGLKIVRGESPWEIATEPGQEVEHIVALAPTRDGMVAFRSHWTSAGTDGGTSSQMAWRVDGDEVRPCKRGVCDDLPLPKILQPPPPTPDADERVKMTIRNHSGRACRVAIARGPAQSIEGARILTIDSGEILHIDHRKDEWVHRINPDGKTLGGGVFSDEDGALMTIRGKNCEGHRVVSRPELADQVPW